MTRPFEDVLDEDGAIAAWSRRAFLKVMGASAAMGVAACEKPKERIVPYVRAPEDVVPGNASYYATTHEVHGLGIGLLVESHEGRPTKVEGNPRHPASRGAADLASQAAILGLYDPSRASGVNEHGMPRPFTTLASALSAQRGKGLAILLEPTSSPLLAATLARVRAVRPDVRIHFHAPWSPTARWTGSKKAFGRVVEALPVPSPRVVASFGADVLAARADSMHLARAVIGARRWTVETAMTVTGASSSERLAVRPSALVPTIAAVLGALARRPGPLVMPPEIRTRLATLPGSPFAEGLARDLDAQAMFACGDDVPAEGHLLVHALRAAVTTPRYIRSPILEAGEHVAPRLDDVGAALVLGGDPVLADPALGDHLRAVPLSAHLGAVPNATARACQWQIAEAHWLESWGDVRAFDGSPSIVQPLIRPMHGGRTRFDLLALLAGERSPDAHATLLASTPEIERTLARGTADGAFATEEVTLDWNAVVLAAEAARASSEGIELATVFDPKLDDGRDAGNAWLQELPDPITKQTWGNALWLSPRTAKELGVATGDVVAIARGATVEAPVLVMPGHADGAATIALGYGGDVGVDAWPLGRITTAATIRPTGRKEPLAITMAPVDTRDREILEKEPKKEPKKSLYFLPPSGTQQWAMSIDLEKCTGCSVCVVACQAENNVPVVGKEGVLEGREMHWLRIDRYVEDAETDHPKVAMMPMLCQHCESAPCEYVCPVGATTHSADGLNQMTYPRCVGTRFCSNNCPYKVRRFNWFNYNRDTPVMRALAHNPDVTVRARGVMEKCTYCVQRIREAERTARVEHRPLATGDVVTACQQACPTDAIAFGSLSDPSARVVKERADARSYSALSEVGTRPRTTYLSRKRGAG